MLLCGCSTKKEQQGEAFAVDSLHIDSVRDTSAMVGDSADYKALAAEVRQRVAAMYDDIFDHYNREDFNNWNSHDLYFSDSLKWYWAQLPDDEEVIEMDPWTWAQDYDTLKYKKIEAELLAKDTAKATVTLSLWKESKDYPITLTMVCENQGWYVNDVKYEKCPSLIDEIRSYIKEYKQN